MKNFKAVCFYGKQTSKFNVEQTEEVDADGKQKFNKIIKHDTSASKALKVMSPDQDSKTVTKKTNVVNKSKPPTKNKKPSKRSNLHLEHKPSDEMDLLISTLNDADLGWKADTCKLQKHHAKYGEG